MGDTVSSLLFQPPPPSKLKEHKIVWLSTRLGNKIPGFYISYRRSNGFESCRSLSVDEIRDSNPQDGITILYSHANAEDLGSIYPWCKFLSKMLQVNLFAYDYSGYGMATSCGPPSEEHCYADIEAAYAYLRHELHVPSQNIVLYGRSLGSGPSCHLAAQTALLVDPTNKKTANGKKNLYRQQQASKKVGSDVNKTQTESQQQQQQQDELEAPTKKPQQQQQSTSSIASTTSGASATTTTTSTLAGDGPIGGLILHAPFLSVYRVVIDTGCTLLGDKFPNIDIIGMTKSPTILIHGTSDQIVPFRHSERLLNAIPKEYRAKPIYIEGMSHNNVHAQVRPLFVDRLVDYLYEHVWPTVVVRKGSTHGGGGGNVASYKASSSVIAGQKHRSKIWKMVQQQQQQQHGITANGGGNHPESEDEVDKLRSFIVVRTD